MQYVFPFMIEKDVLQLLLALSNRLSSAALLDYKTSIDIWNIYKHVMGHPRVSELPSQEEDIHHKKNTFVETQKSLPQSIGKYTNTGDSQMSMLDED